MKLVPCTDGLGLFLSNWRAVWQGWVKVVVDENWFYGISLTTRLLPVWTLEAVFAVWLTVLDYPDIEILFFKRPG